MRQAGSLCVALLLQLVLVGCGNRQSPQAGAPPPPEVVVTRPVVKEITDYEDFPGRTEAVAGVEVRARVTGYLEKVLFKEGTEVKQGDPLFVIDPRPYEAQLHAAEGNQAQNKATQALAATEFGRAEQLLPKNAIAGTDYDQAKNALAVAKARVQSGEAALETARLNLDFCSITAPISGRISRQLIDAGNMVQADQTPLTTIVSLDPVYAYFDVDERTMLKVRRLIRAGKVQSSREAAMPVFLGLLDETGFSHEGTINFVDNRVDSQSGTLRIRGIFPNEKRMISPGMFVRIRLPIGKPHEAILISEQALRTDQGQKSVFVVNDREEIAERPIKVGSLQHGLRVVEEGLTQNDRVVISRLQQLQRGAKVKPQLKEPRDEAAPLPSPALKAEPQK